MGPPFCCHAFDPTSPKDMPHAEIAQIAKIREGAFAGFLQTPRTSSARNRWADPQGTHRVALLTQGGDLAKWVQKWSNMV